MHTDAPADELAPALPDEVPVLPLREFVAFPYMVLPLFAARERSIAAVDDALAGHRTVLLVAQRDASQNDPDPDDLYRVGTLGVVLRAMHLADGRVKVLVQCQRKARIDSFIPREGCDWVRATPLAHDEEEGWSVEGEAIVRAVRARVEELLPIKNLPPEVMAVAAHVDRPGRLADLVASHLRLRVAEAQEILETNDALARLRRVDAVLRRELEVTSAQAELQAQPVTRAKPTSDDQREAFLREQLRAIQQELGESDPRSEEVEEYRGKIDDAALPPDAHEEAMRQLRRMERMHPDGPEAQVVRNYLDWLVDLPWDLESTDVLDLEHARAVLDADHAHLEGVKDRILEFLGVRKLRQDSRGPILCFAGPPGVGKTSLGRSIARAMGREFVRISLGGVRDEAEIRGHRRTYVGAMPGRIVQALKQAGTNNPVFMLDEIDKLGADFRGDPSAALLEVLDPEQNSDFSDHFLSVPFDLSKVLFIATANMLDPIPAPLRDRMEVIQLSGYTPEEKIDIASRFLVPRQIEEHGLASTDVEFSRTAVASLATEYTREAGVRNLDRKVAAVCRKLARRIAEGGDARVTVDKRALRRLLGPPTAGEQGRAGDAEVGVATGLAWTEAGGDVLQIEAALTRGEGLVLTGQLGDVMKESGRAALSYARSVLAEIDADESLLSRREVHVHVPAGAVPKDGPSAGVTIATAMLSLATGIPVRGDVAMTGEITLRGRVLPVGGVREKALAALRSGIRRVILPKANLQDVAEIPRELKRKLTFVPVSTMRDVLDAALETPLPWRAPKRSAKARAGGVAPATARGRR
ncbi:MAG: endopeptidase La [Myxococcota bacterium]|nr:endopeptidase La [Myxococcales bacterium]